MLNELKSELKDAMIGKWESKINAIRMILGEVPRLNKKKGEIVTKDEILNIIRKLVKSERQTLEYKNEVSSEYITILESYLPKMMDENDVIEFINNTVDFDSFPNKMKAMGPIMKLLKGKVDGNLVKKVLVNL